MISGFNTDIEHNGVTYHVQTEDKGLDTPFILSLVYDRGTILASKRTPYTDLLEDFNEKILADRLQKQHSIICAAVNAGRIEDLKKMTQRESQKNKEHKETALPDKKSEKDKLSDQSEPEIKTNDKSSVSRDAKSLTPKSASAPAPAIENQSKPQPVETPVKEVSKKNLRDSSPIKGTDETTGLSGGLGKKKSVTGALKPISEGQIESELPITESKAIEDHKTPNQMSAESALVEKPQSVRAPDDSATRQSEAKGSQPSPSPTLEEDYAKYIDTIEGNLSIGVPADVEFYGGESKVFKVSVHHRITLEKIENALITIKILSSAFRPLQYKTRTNAQGIADVQIHIPSFSDGRTAVVFRATNATEEGELRKNVEPNRQPYI